MAHLKITFNLDGTGVCYYPHYPLHLDSILAWCLAPNYVKGKNLQRDDCPDEIPLPLVKCRINGASIFQASSLFHTTEEVTESMAFWRKRFRTEYIDLTKGSFDLKQGPFRSWNMPLPIHPSLQMIAYANGNRKGIKSALKKLKALGKKTAYGYGRIQSIEIEEIEENRSMIFEGKAMRYLPHPEGSLLVRPRPPYWNNHGKVAHMNVGESI